MFVSLPVFSGKDIVGPVEIDQLCCCRWWWWCYCYYSYVPVILKKLIFSVKKKKKNQEKPSLLDYQCSTVSSPLHIQKETFHFSSFLFPFPSLSSPHPFPSPFLLSLPSPPLGRSFERANYFPNKRISHPNWRTSQKSSSIFECGDLYHCWGVS